MVNEVTDILDMALTELPGQGVELEFATPLDARRFRNRLCSTIAASARWSQRELPPDDPSWGKSAWPGITTAVEGRKVWVGRAPKPKVRQNAAPPAG